MQEETYVAFAGVRQIAAGPLRGVLPILKDRFDKEPAEIVLVFETWTGRQVEFDLRGSLEDILAREAPLPHRGPGRPRLGVTSREVSLLPRHWDWLDAQPNGASATLRRLVEHAMKSEPAQQRAARARAALGKFLTSMAGDRPHYEEASRALYRGETPRFEELVRRWPKDVRDYAIHQARAAADAEREAM
jgi:hypothetical protein